MSKDERNTQVLLSPEPDEVAKAVPELAEKIRKSTPGTTESGRAKDSEKAKGADAVGAGGTGGHGAGLMPGASQPGRAKSPVYGAKSPVYGAKSPVGGDKSPRGPDAFLAGEEGDAVQGKKSRRKVRLAGKPGQRTWNGWDGDKPLGPHSMDHLPTYPELAPQIKEHIEEFMKRNPPVPPLSEHGERLGSGDQAKIYLKTHAIREMFQMMISGLLFHHPDHPLDYLVDMAREMNHQRSAMLAAEDQIRRATGHLPIRSRYSSSEAGFRLSTSTPAPPPSMVTDFSDTDLPENVG